MVLKNSITKKYIKMKNLSILFVKGDTIFQCVATKIIATLTGLVDHIEVIENPRKNQKFDVEKFDFIFTSEFTHKFAFCPKYLKEEKTAAKIIRLDKGFSQSGAEFSFPKGGDLFFAESILIGKEGKKNLKDVMAVCIGKKKLVWNYKRYEIER